MIGISSFGAYVPLYRLARSEIGRAWAGVAAPGEKAIANFDEDSVTLAVAAGLDCLKGMDRSEVGSLYFGTTTAPYLEKEAAVIISYATDLNRQVFTADFSNSLRAGTTAMRAAMDAVKAGTVKKAMVTTADCRQGMPGSEFEQVFGDGAAAFLISDSNLIATVEGEYSHNDDIIDVWRTGNDRFVQMWEDRFVIIEGYMANVQEAASAILKKYNLTPKDITKAVFYAPDARRHAEMTRALGLDPKTQVADPLFNTIGNTGAAFAPMMLVAALEEAKPGDRILFISYGDGCDAFIFKVTDLIDKMRDRNGIKKLVAAKKPIFNYERYIRNRRLMEVEVGRRRPPWVTSAAAYWRDRSMILRLQGSKCRNCGRLFFPPQRVCIYCRAKDNFEHVRLADMKGTLYTFSKDELATTLDPPVIMSVVNLEGGARFMGQMTDRDPDQVNVNTPVEMTFRMLVEAGGFYNYFWKCQPLRIGGEQ